MRPDFDEWDDAAFFRWATKDPLTVTGYSDLMAPRSETPTKEASMKTLTDNIGTVWEVVEAESDEAAWNAINHARVSGSTGCSHYVQENGVERVQAIVRRAANVRTA